MTALILGQNMILQFEVIPKARQDKTFEVRVIQMEQKKKSEGGEKG